jgi:hypothetical protein
MNANGTIIIPSPLKENPMTKHLPTTPNTFLMSGTRMASSITTVRIRRVEKI